MWGDTVPYSARIPGEPRPVSPSPDARDPLRTPLRLCRFCMEDGTPLVGLYEGDFVIPLDEAAVDFFDAADLGLVIPESESLLEVLPPDGSSLEALRTIANWVRNAPDAPALDDLAIPIDQVRLLVPIPRPGKILLLAGNYAKHVEERGGTTAEREETFPYVFMKPTTALTNPNDPIVLPAVSPDHIDWECELGVIIGRTCRDVPETEALGYVAGYTVVNDISDRKFQPNPSRKPRERDKFFDWLHGKWHDTFLPVGPCVLSADSVPDPQRFPIRLSVNGEVKQDGSTGQMVFPVAAIVSFLSTFLTLEPGDLIATGTPSGVGSATGTYLKPGDVVVAEIPGIGRLINPVVAAR